MSGDGTRDRVVALSGGIGGAKLALGLYRHLPLGTLTVICNPGDDFEHLGLSIWPDFDTVLYTLADLADRERGWGRAGETWTFMQALASFGGETWFQLGDGDLALHVERTRRLAAGERASTIARQLTAALAIHADLLPPADQPVRTFVETPGGALPFQHYFVRDRCEHAVRGFRFEGARQAVPTPEVVAALGDPRLRAVIICPSNPFISIEPMLAIPAMRQLLRASGAPVVAVSPIVGGEAIKGPTARMLRDLGHPVSAAAVARRYGPLIDGFVLDLQDAGEAGAIPQAVATAQTVMRSDADRIGLAAQVLALADRLRDG